VAAVISAINDLAAAEQYRFGLLVDLASRHGFPERPPVWQDGQTQLLKSLCFSP